MQDKAAIAHEDYFDPPQPYTPEFIAVRTKAIETERANIALWGNPLPSCIVGACGCALMTLTAHAAVGFVVLLLAGLVLFSSIHVRNGERNVWLDSCDPLVGERLTECRALLARLPNGAKFREAELAQNRSLLYGEYLEIFDWLAGLDVKGSVRNPEGKAA